MTTPSLMRLFLRSKTYGGVRAFVLVALAAEEDENDNLKAVCAMSGKGIDIMKLSSELGKAVMKNIVLKDLMSEE